MDFRNGFNAIGELRLRNILDELNGYTAFSMSTAGQLAITQVSNGQSLIDFNPSPASGNAAYVRLFRGTGNATEAGLQILRANNTAAVNSFIGANTHTYFNNLIGNVGIKTTNPLTDFDVNGVSYQRGGVYIGDAPSSYSNAPYLSINSKTGSFVWLTTVASGNVPQQVVFQRAGSDGLNPTALLDGDAIGVLSFRGYTGAGYTGSTVQIGVEADADWDGSNYKTRVFIAQNTGSPNALTRRFEIDGFGNVVFTPSTSFQVAAGYVTVAQDVHPYNNGRGIWGRMNQPLGAPDHHFGGGLPVNYAWSTSPHTSPSTVNYTNDTMSLPMTSGQRHMLARTATVTTTKTITIRASATANGMVGIRFDTANDNNYCIFGITTSGTTLYNRFVFSSRHNSGTVSTSNSTAFIANNVYVMQLVASYTAPNTTYSAYIVNEFGVKSLMYTVTLAHQPTRYGVVFNDPLASTGVNTPFAMIDWIQET